MKMGRRLSGTCRIGHVSVQICYLLPPVRLGSPCRRPILIATKYLVFLGQDTSCLRCWRNRTAKAWQPWPTKLREY